MAARSGPGAGVVSTITILGVSTLVLFVTTIIFLSKFQATQKDLDQMREDNRTFISDGERNQDDVRNLLAQAQQQRQSLVGYLMDSQDTTMQWVTGTPSDSIGTLDSKLDSINGAKTTPLLRLIRDRDATIADLQRQVAVANDERIAALEDRQNEVNSKQELQRLHDQTIAAMEAQIEQQAAEVETYRQSVQTATDSMDSRVARIQTDGQAERDELSSRLQGAQQTILDLEEQLAKLRKERSPEILSPLPEAGLADGTVLEVFPADNYVVIGRGRDDKVVLGMTFAVYAQGTTIRPDENGNYPRGKATIEVIGVDKNSSRGRITSSTTGDPIVRGDIIANAVYDPHKIYKFVVFGNFDTNRDGISTPQESMNIEAMIDAWGGRVVAELAGDIDFLVLGERPILPPEPDPNSPIELIREYIRLREIVDRYDQLLSRAQSTSIPILNQNSLVTLIGR